MVPARTPILGAPEWIIPKPSQERSPKRDAVADHPSPFPVRYIQNPDMQRRIAALKDDPDFEEFFNDVQNNGPSAMTKYSICL